jgi:hypothetical protein
MMSNLVRSLLIAFVASVVWTTTSEACHRRRSCGCTNYNYARYTCGGYGYAGQTGYYGAGGGYYSGGYGYTQPGYGQPGYAQPGYAQPGYNYGYGPRGYNPGGLGGPASGLGVRPGVGAGGFGPGR